MNILYVEDNMANIAFVERVASMGMHQVEHLGSAEEAIQYIMQFDVDILLLDIQLSGELDGVDFIEVVRGKGYSRPIIVITAYDTPMLKERCYAAGCDEYYSKPIPVTQLQQIFKRYEVQ